MCLIVKISQAVDHGITSCKMYSLVLQAKVSGSDSWPMAFLEVTLNLMFMIFMLTSYLSVLLLENLNILLLSFPFIVLFKAWRWKGRLVWAIRMRKTSMFSYEMIFFSTLHHYLMTQTHLIFVIVILFILEYLKFDKFLRGFLFPLSSMSLLSWVGTIWLPIVV